MYVPSLFLLCFVPQQGCPGKQTNNTHTNCYTVQFFSVDAYWHYLGRERAFGRPLKERCESRLWPAVTAMARLIPTATCLGPCLGRPCQSRHPTLCTNIYGACPGRAPVEMAPNTAPPALELWPMTLRIKLSIGVLTLLEGIRYPDPIATIRSIPVHHQAACEPPQSCTGTNPGRLNLAPIPWLTGT